MRTRFWLTVIVLTVIHSKLAHGADSAPASYSTQLERAGCPHIVAPRARPSRSSHDVGYYVGGGAVKNGDARYCHEGTWGHDYQLFPGKLPFSALGWHHGRKFQGGSTSGYRSN